MSKQYNQADMEAAAKELVGKFINEQEDVAMGVAEKVKETMEQAVENVVENVKVVSGEEYHEFFERADDSINTIKDSMTPVLTLIGDGLGLTTLKDRIVRIIYLHGEKANGRNGFIKMAREIRAIIEEDIEFLELGTNEESFKTVVALRGLLGEDANGNKVEHQSVFMAFARGLAWICRKVSRKIRQWFGTDAESNVFGSVGASIAKVFATIGKVVGAGVKLVGLGIVFVASYALAGVVTVASLVVRAVMFVVNKIKGAATKLHDKIEDFEDDFFEEEGVVVEELE